MVKRNPRANSRPGQRGGAWIYGRHAVLAALANSARACQELVVTRALAAELLEGPRATPLPQGLSPVVLPKDEISRLLIRGAVHQGIALQVDPLPDPDLVSVCRPDGRERSVVVVLDQVTDPQNVGAILRSAAAFGARAVITTERNAPPPMGTLAKAASGALEHVPYVRVANLGRALDTLASLGFWRLGLDGTAPQTLQDADTSGHIALVFGAEGAGLRRLTAQKCDFLIRLPMSDKVESLNVSNAAAVALYEVTRTPRVSEAGAPARS